MTKPLPPPLPPEERTVGQVVAESIRLYGQRFWAALLLGLPIAVITQFSAGHSLTAQTLVLWAATPLLTGAYLGAIVIAAPERPPRSALIRAFVVGVVVFLPVPALLRTFVLPALAWLAAASFCAPSRTPTIDESRNTVSVRSMTIETPSAISASICSCNFNAP